MITAVLTNNKNLIENFLKSFSNKGNKFTKWVNPDNGNPITFIEALNILKSRISEILK